MQHSAKVPFLTKKKNLFNVKLFIFIRRLHVTYNLHVYTTFLVINIPVV